MESVEIDGLVSRIERELRSAGQDEVPHLNLALSALHDLQKAKSAPAPVQPVVSAQPLQEPEPTPEPFSVDQPVETPAAKKKWWERFRPS